MLNLKEKKCKNTNQEPNPEVLTHIVNLLNRNFFSPNCFFRNKSDDKTNINALFFYIKSL